MMMMMMMMMHAAAADAKLMRKFDILFFRIRTFYHVIAGDNFFFAYARLITGSQVIRIRSFYHGIAGVTGHGLFMCV